MFGSFWVACLLFGVCFPTEPQSHAELSDARNMNISKNFEIKNAGNGYLDWYPSRAANTAIQPAILTLCETLVGLIFIIEYSLCYVLPSIENWQPFCSKQLQS